MRVECKIFIVQKSESGPHSCKQAHRSELSGTQRTLADIFFKHNMPLAELTVNNEQKPIGAMFIKPWKGREEEPDLFRGILVETGLSTQRLSTFERSFVNIFEFKPADPDLLEQVIKGNQETVLINEAHTRC